MSSIKDKCPWCIVGNIVKKVCDECGHVFGNFNPQLENRRKRPARENLPSRDDRKRMRKAEEKLGYDPFMTSIKG